MVFCCRWAFPTQGMTRHFRGSAQRGHPEGWKHPSTTEPHIGFFFLHNTTKKLPFTLSEVVPAVQQK